MRTFHDSAVFEFTITDTRGQLPEVVGAGLGGTAVRVGANVCTA